MLSQLVPLGAIAQTLDQASMVKRANDMVTKIVTIAHERANTNEKQGLERDEVIAELSNIFGLENDPHTLVRVVMVTWVYRSGLIEDVAIDDVFILAEGLALVRVKEIGGDEALDALEYLLTRGHLDGGRGVIVEELIYQLRSTKSLRK